MKVERQSTLTTVTIENVQDHGAMPQQNHDAPSVEPRAVAPRAGGRKLRVFSGIQPTGGIHLGRYLGAVENWVRLQETYDAIYCIVDLHALTIDYEPRRYQERIKGLALDLLATGIDPERCIMFVQSRVHEHAELQWLLSTVTPLGILERMTQYKDKAQLHEDNINLGLLAYPVLQAADIMLYKSEAVPVGEDQAQHLELTREIAGKFNRRFGQIFPEPQTMLTEAKRLPGLDGLGKMSASKGNVIDLTDAPDDVWAKVRPAVTDPARKRRTDPGDPHKCPIGLMHYALSSPQQQAYITQGCTTAGIGCLDCKKILTENVNTLLAPIRERRAALEAEPERVLAILDDGAQRARQIASKTLDEVKDVMGLR